jgi:hypothetical protein
MSTNLNRKLVLHKVPFPSQSEEKDEFVVITIVEVKQVPNTWSKGTNEGWRATDKNGKEYFCNWESFPDDSSSPSWSWNSRNEQGKFEEWFDVLQGLRDYVEYCPVFLNDPEISKIIDWCPDHLCLFDKNSTNGCFKCFLEKQYGKKEKPNIKKFWNGWY